jgi:hypothetical protein
MHLYDAGVPLPYIRDILGHVDLSTTEIYARASTEAKRKALETVYARSSARTWPNGTKTPTCSTGSPASNRPSRVMRSVQPSTPLAAGTSSQRCA